jgi:hypothetical protein
MWRRYSMKAIVAEARDAFRNLVALDAKNGRAWGMLGLCGQTRGERAVVSLQRGRRSGWTTIKRSKQ